MSLSKTYEPKEIENHWYQKWLDNGLFASKPNDKESYTIVIPPPNVTGVLHMGHMLNNTIQDVLARRARMQGFNVCWVPGTDHASIATETKVVDLLKEQGINKDEIGREAFLEKAWEWKDKYGGIIIEQLHQLGCSCDWERERFTMEDSLSEAVIEVFNQMHEEGYIYRGSRMINWDPVGKTALSDEEVLYEESNTNLFYIKYPLVDGSGYISVATTRPETVMGDTAVCVNPNDERYADFIGKKCIVPLANREVTIIADEYVEIEFGTGALKITPAHDINDMNIGLKHQLETIDVLNDDATMNEHGGKYEGLDRFKARKVMAKDIEEAGLLIEIEQIKNKVGKSERSKAVVEPRISAQWFVNMEKFMEDHPEVLSSVMDDEIQFHPAKFKNTYRHWITNIKDWCISRQLWWGHRIPAWFKGSTEEYVVAMDAEKALMKAKARWGDEITIDDLRQDEDVLDTWFSSWLWPISVFDGFKEEGKEEIDYYYPTSDLVTAPDIIFFWVARMIMAGYKFKGIKPFNNVYFTGIVRDKQRRKMSKSLGNSPDPLELMSQFGTDGVRLGLLMSSAAGNDLMFDEALCEQGRNFCNKLWNAYRLVDHLESADQALPIDEDNENAHAWMASRINDSIKQVDDFANQYRLSDAVTILYKLIWNDYCSWYLEWIKPGFGKRLSTETIAKAKEHFETLLRLIHPFTPFISEHLSQQLSEDETFINTKDWPKFNSQMASVDLSKVFEFISQVRALRNKNGISPKSKGAFTFSDDPYGLSDHKQVIEKLGNCELTNSVENPLVVMLGKQEISMAFEGFENDTSLDIKATQEEIKRLNGFLVGIGKKLDNPKFMANAKPEVIEREQKKKQDTMDKIKSLEQQLSQAQ